MAVCYNNKAIALTKKENTDSDTSKCQMVTTVFVLKVDLNLAAFSIYK